MTCPCDQPVAACYQCPVWQRQDYQLALAVRLVMRRTHLQAVHALVARRLAEGAERDKRLAGVKL